MKNKRTVFRVANDVIIQMLGTTPVKVTLPFDVQDNLVPVHNGGAVFFFHVKEKIGDCEVILGALASVEGFERHWMINKPFFIHRSDEECSSIFGVLFEARDNAGHIAYLGKPYREKGMFWCRHFEAVTEEDSGTCGKSCPGYEPKNGKWGMCAHKELNFHEPGEPVVFLEETAKKILHGLDL